ncbi:NUDIX hydrolase [Halobacillus salinus]|uniref:8-oxo-dGTP diphosphatase n=1 Tax=Halobacillus salinus TaxID=192814 RepID=A0A4Z0H6Y6_9BACI|nr:8-oxo-dGTP diphosphatase [Halobacillus salinus]TGB04876.1 8-oxo-dGTP diphosphatase [Halobacillus salinus]
MYSQTLCFLMKEDKLLMLNRNRAPGRGLWNGVGGKMEEEEDRTQCVIREVEEETGITIDPSEFIYKGIVEWEVEEKYADGMYIYFVCLPDDFHYPTPLKVDEGILEWKRKSWLLEERNPGVGGMIPYYLPNVLQEPSVIRHKFIVHNEQVTRYEYFKMEEQLYKRDQ